MDILVYRKDYILKLETLNFKPIQITKENGCGVGVGFWGHYLPFCYPVQYHQNSN